MTPNNIILYASTTNQDARLPLCAAAASSMEWNDTKRIYDANTQAIDENDVITSLSQFMLATVGRASNIELVYRLI